MQKFLKTLLLSALMMLPWVTNAQTHYNMQIGTGTSTSQYVPDYGYYNYAYSQMLYTAAEVGIDGEIDTLAFQVSSGSATRTVTIYMAEVSQTNLSSQVDASELHQVFSGSVSWSAGWVTIALDSVFEYQGTGSLVIACIDATGTYVSGYPYFSGTSMSETRSRYIYNDYNSYTTSSSMTYSTSFLPNVKIGINSYSSYCAAPSNVTIGNINNDEADISWTENGGAMDWEIIISDSVVTDFANANSFTTSTNPYTVSNLNGNTLYYVYVRAVCDGSSYSAWTSAVTFRSACVGYTSIPYSTGFEELTTGALPNCWQQVASGSSSASTFPAAYVWQPNARNSSVYFEFESSTGQTEIAALPAMENINTLMLTFYASCMNTNFTFEAGVLEESTFVPVQTVQLTAGSGGNWSGSYYPYTVYYGGYTGSSERMALRVTAAAGTSYTLMIDDLTVDYLPTCPEPTNLVLDSVSTDWAAISWVENGNASSWVVEYDTVDFVPGSSSAANSLMAQSTDITLTGLDSGYTYYVYVSADCGSDYSQYTSLMFSTLAGAPASLPLICDFEGGGVNGWELVNGTQTNHWMVGTAVNNGGNKSLYITNDDVNNSYTNTSTSYSYAIRNINIGEAGEFVYSFDWRNQGESHYYDFIRVFLTPASAEFNAGSVLGGSCYSFATYNIPSNWIDLSGISGSPKTLAQESTWQNVTGTFTLTTPGTYKLVFAWANDGGGGSNPAAAIDNVQLIRNTCPAPINLTVTSVTTTDISIEWQSLGDETLWEVFDGTNSYLATDTSYMLTGLIPDHQYNIRVRAICGADDTSMSISTSARTLQSCVRPVGIAIDSVLGDTIWVSWTDTTNATQYDLAYGFTGFDPDTAMVNVVYNIADTNSYMFTGLTMGQRYDFYVRNDCGSEQSSWVGPASAVPSYTYTMAATGSDTLHVCGYTIYDDGGELNNYSSSSNSTLVVFPNDPTMTIQISGTGNVETNYDHLYVYDGVGTAGTMLFHGQGAFTMPATNSESGAVTIVFTSDGSVNYAGFELSVACVPLPDCPHPSQLVVNNIGIQSAEISWTELGSATEWIVQYDTVNFTPGDNTTANSLMVNTNPYTLTGLDSGMTYYVYVASFCNPDTSDFINTSFTTLAASPATLPYSCNFEAAGVNGWDLINDGQTNYWTVGSATNNGGSRSMYITDNGTDNNYSAYESYSFAVRNFALAAGDYICSYEWKCTGESSYDFIRVALVPASTNIAAGGYCGFDNASSMPAGGIALDGGYRMNQQNSWATQTVEFSVATAGTYKLVFMWRNDDLICNQTPAAIDNVVLMANTCPIPTGLVSTASTSTSITVDWNAPAASNPQGWEVRYGDNSGNNTGIVYTTSHPITISNLTALTNYAVSVRAVCAAGDTSAWSGAVIFSTDMCDNVVTVTNFDTTMSPVTSSYSPIGYSTYNYSYTQTIIDADQLAALAGDITAFAFSAASTSAGSYFTNMTVYMANIPDSISDLSSDFIHPSTDIEFVKVINGADFSYSSVGLQIHGFDTAFTWDGQSNILFSVAREHGSWSSGASFNAHTQTSGKMRYAFTDSGPYDYTTVTGGSTADAVGDIYLISCGGGCAKPALLPVTNRSYNTATVNWNSNATDFEVAYKAVTDGVWPDAVAVSNASSYTFNGLNPATQYQYRVRTICDATENLISDWAIGTFTTDSLPCFAPTDLHTTNVGYTSTTLAWNAMSGQNRWTLTVWNTAGSVDYDVTGNAAYTVTGLTQDNQYYAAVKAVCGNGAAESEYSDTIQFTTNNCEQVAGVTVTNITENSAVVSWQAATATSYEVDYGPVGHGQGQGTTVTVNGVTTYTITGLESETGYSVYVHALCEADAPGPWSQVQEFTTLEGGIGIDVADGMNVSIYPNPTSSTTTIALSGVNGDVAITVVDMNGRVVMSDSMSCEGDCVKTMEVSGLAQGAYFVRINGENVNMVKKLVVK